MILRKMLFISLGAVFINNIYASDISETNKYKDTDAYIYAPSVQVKNTVQSDDDDNILDDDIRIIGSTNDQDIYSLRINGGKFVSTYLNGPSSNTAGPQANGVFYIIRYKTDDNVWHVYNGDSPDYRFYPVTGLLYQHQENMSFSYFNGYIKPRPMSIQLVLNNHDKKDKKGKDIKGTKVTQIKIEEALSDFGSQKVDSNYMPKEAFYASTNPIDLPTWKDASTSDDSSSFNPKNYIVSISNYTIGSSSLTDSSSGLNDFYANGVYAFPIIVKIHDKQAKEGVYLDPYSTDPGPSGYSGEAVFSHLGVYTQKNIIPDMDMTPVDINENNIFSATKTVIVPADILSSNRDNPANDPVRPLYGPDEEITPLAGQGKAFLVYTTQTDVDAIKDLFFYVSGQDTFQLKASQFNGTANLKSYKDSFVEASYKDGRLTYTLKDYNGPQRSKETATNLYFVNVKSPTIDDSSSWVPIDYIVDNWSRTSVTAEDPDNTNIDDLSKSDSDSTVSHKPDAAPRGIYYVNLQSGIMACHPFKNTEFCTQHVPYNYSNEPESIFLDNASTVDVGKQTVSYEESIDSDDNKKIIAINGSRDLYIYDNTGRLHYVSK